jgi:RNA polymerase sigma factor (sigma-70 family)
MVLAVCRQILRHSHDADDAFQATFLVLVRQARSIRTRESLAPWLYSVAQRTAHRARAIALRHRPGEDEQVPEVVVPAEDVYKLDLRPLLHEELGRLPDKYRAPIVLCHLEGRTHEEAARLLRWPAAGSSCARGSSVVGSPSPWRSSPPPGRWARRPPSRRHWRSASTMPRRDSRLPNRSRLRSFP